MQKASSKAHKKANGKLVDKAARDQREIKQAKLAAKSQPHTKAKLQTMARPHSAPATKAKPSAAMILNSRPLPEAQANAQKTHQKSAAPGQAPATLKKGHKFRLDEQTLRKIYDIMTCSRALEERLIKMYKQSDGYFWIGGPGEEAFNVPLGLQVNKGQGINHDYLHLHYRSSAIVTAMGANPMDAIRQMKNVATDPYSGGRNFSNHFSKKAWNIVPVTSTIETQYATAIGTGLAQRGKGCKGITIVNGGDAGTAEGEFASCMVWSSRPKFELPVLMIVTNNLYGISTPYEGQHGEKRIADRGAAFQMKTGYINGNDVEESWFALKDAMDYVRDERKPFMMEARVSRLYGHSSATGGNRIDEVDPLKVFEDQLESAGVFTRKEMDAEYARWTQTMLEFAQKVKEEPMPDPSSIYDYTYAGQKGRYW